MTENPNTGDEIIRGLTNFRDSLKNDKLQCSDQEEQTLRQALEKADEELTRWLGDTVYIIEIAQEMMDKGQISDDLNERPSEETLRLARWSIRRALGRE